MKRVLKWVGTALLVVAILAVVTGFVLYSRGKGAVEKTYAVTGLIQEASADSAALARGAHLAQTLVCRDCHGDNLAGAIMIDAPPFLVVASNLTPGSGSVTTDYSVADWDRAIRYGVKKDGRAVFPMMPSKYYHNLTDEDVAALIGYLKSLEPVNNELPASELRAMGAMIVGAGGLDLADYVSTEPHRVTPPAPGPTADYGRYIASLTCKGCHGEDLRGGEELEPGAPLPPDVSMAGAWPIELFDQAVRGGISSAGNQMHRLMPSKYYSSLTDDELTALHEYFKTLPNAS